MGLITKEIRVFLTNRTTKHYRSLGYLQARNKQEIIVKTEHLSDGSHEKIDVECDGCGEILKNKAWKEYKKYVKDDGKYYCNKCASGGYKRYISFYDWCYENLSKEEADKIMLRWDYDLNIDKDGNMIFPKDICKGSVGFNNKGYWFKCLDYSEHNPEQKSINDFTDGCAGSIKCNQCNKIGVTNPELIKFLVNKEDAYKYSIGSSTEKVLMKCPDCGCEKLIRIPDLIKDGLGCPKCSDGISYPEKFLFNVLEQLLDNNFIPQLSRANFKWCKNFRYDFYINKTNTIIETHGVQHYEEKPNWGTLEDTQKNDKQKEQLAKNNNISNYIVIDCRESDMGWIKNNILQSALPILLDFKEDDINWLECHEYACKSLVKEICQEWSNGNKNINKIAEKYKISIRTIGRYLKSGEEFGWCDYALN